jgi:pyruvate/2-oxoglutarate dehydrogenase complex dihydrolipoamide acyltransferase (E2) component
MHVDFLMPDLGLTRGSALVGQWLVDVGANVLEGDALVEISAEGVTVELASPVEGRLSAVFVTDDDPVAPGHRLAVFSVDLPQDDRQA